MDLAAGVLNMMHFGALLLAASLILTGWLLANGDGLASFALISLGVIIVLIQVLSRLRHVWRFRVLREKAGCLEVLLRSSGKWIPGLQNGMR